MSANLIVVVVVVGLAMLAYGLWRWSRKSNGANDAGEGL